MPDSAVAVGWRSAAAWRRKSWCPPYFLLARTTLLRAGGPGRSQDPAGRGLIGRGYQYADTLQLQLRVQPRGIICRHGRSHAVAAQQAGDQFRLRRLVTTVRVTVKPFTICSFGIMIALPSARRIRSADTIPRCRPPAAPVGHTVPSPRPGMIAVRPASTTSHPASAPSPLDGGSSRPGRPRRAG